MTMSILHIWDTGGVASVLSKYLRKNYRVKSTVVSIDYNDPCNITTFYGGQHYPGGTTVTNIRFLMKGLMYDIIHIHSAYHLVKHFKRLYPYKKVVMHFHGGDVRKTGWNNLKDIRKNANLVFVSTPDLLDGAPNNVLWLPNPIDIELFKPMPSLRNTGTALHFSFGADDLAAKYARKHGLELTIYDRKKHGWIPHWKFPEFLCQYEYCIDVKRVTGGKIGPALSKTGLEALACGLKVIRWDGEVIEELPEEHNPVNVVTKLWSLYQKLG